MGQLSSLPSKYLALVVLMAVQAACVVFFLVDVVGDISTMGISDDGLFHIGSEVVANAVLAIAIIVEGRVLIALVRRQAETDRALSVASGALSDVIEAYFREWNLTPTEADIATFTIKGYSIAEVARIRGSADGTIKTHLNAIYRKAGVAGRAQLVSLLIEDLLNGRIADRAAGRDATDQRVDAIA